MNYFPFNFAARKFKRVPHLLNKPQLLGAEKREQMWIFNRLRLMGCRAPSAFVYQLLQEARKQQWDFQSLE